MDGDQFDRLARTLGRGLPRRGMLGGLAGSTLAALLAGDAFPTTAKRRKRKRRKKKCAHTGQKTSKKRKHCCKGLAKGADGRCREKCDVCASGCAFSSVQDAIDAADPGDTILICAGLYLETIVIDQDLTLIGAGDGEDPAGNTILDANGSGRVIHIASDTVALQKLRLTGGSASSGGGGLLNDNGAVTMTGCTVSENTANYGGGIANPNGGTLTMTDCSVTWNATSVGPGGGIWNGDTVTMTDCTVTGNTAHRGGGIYNEDTTLTMTGCTISGNAAVYDGGGIGNEDYVTVTMTGCTIAGNTAGHNGGGIVNYGGGTSILILDATDVAGNTAGGQGGGIANYGTVNLINGSSVSGNTPDNCVNLEGDTGCP